MFRASLIFRVFQRYPPNSIRGRRSADMERVDARARSGAARRSPPIGKRPDRARSRRSAIESSARKSRPSRGQRNRFDPRAGTMSARAPGEPLPRRLTPGANAAARFAHGSSAPANRTNAAQQKPRRREPGRQNPMIAFSTLRPSSLATADCGASGAIIPQTASVSRTRGNWTQSACSVSPAICRI